MEKIDTLSVGKLLNLVDGVFYWIADSKGARKEGAKAGCKNPNTGSIVIEISGRNYQASHLSWLISKGSYPKHRLEHINSDKLDNRIGNLQEIIPNSIKVDFDLVRFIFDYIDGHLVWREKLSVRSQVVIGHIAGSIQKQKHNEYRFIKIAGKRYKAANLIWLYHKGEMPSMLDHINHIKHDDRIENLRIVSPKENAKNQTLRKNNKYGYNGVSKVKDRWLARISDDKGLRVYLGRYETFKEAVAARKAAEKIYGYHENHGGV